MTNDNEAVIAGGGVAVRHPLWAMLPSSVDVSATMTADEALTLADLNWDVALEPQLRRRRNGDIEEIKDRHMVVRQSDEKILGYVGSHYTIYQNRQAFAFADHLVGEEGIRYTTAFQQRGGRVIGLTVKLPDTVEVAGGDGHEVYLLIRTSHDGTKGVGAYVGMLRQGCTNQTTLMIVQALAKWSVSHTTTLETKIAEAQSALGLTRTYAEEFKQTADRLASIDLELAEFQDLLEHVVPKRPKTAQVIEAICRNFEQSPNLENWRRTAWGGVQSCAEYFDWLRGTTSREAQLTASLEGIGATVRNRTAALLLARAR